MLTLALAALLASGPTLSSRPTVTGALQQGSRLTGTTGSWVGSGTLTYAYQWYRCDADATQCSTVRGATRPTYVLTARDVGSAIGLTVRATDAAGTTAAYAPLAGLVAPRGAKQFATAQPRLDGDPLVGRPLAVEPATWSTAPARATYAWRRCNANGRACSPIAGAVGDSYAVTAADAGRTLLAAVTAGGQTVLSLSTAVVRSAPGPVDEVAPSVAGTLQVGRQLRASAGAWSGAGTVTYTYQWSRCDGRGAHCTSIRGATRPTYVLVAKDAGATLGLTVRATDATGTTAAYAPLAGLVAAPTAKLAATAQPTVTGSATLTVSNGTWSIAPATFAYRWLRCNANGRLCAPIAAATAASYTPAAADRGLTLVATVTATAGTGRQLVLAVAVAVAG